MDKQDCFYLGHISKSSGRAGQVVLFIDASDPTKYRNLESIFLDINGQLTPFFIKAIRINKANATLSIEGIDSIEQASVVLGKEAYLPLTILKPLSGKRFYIHEIIGFKVVDSQKGEIGIINEIMENPGQKIFQIKNNSDKEILVPVSDAVIDKIDRPNNTIFISAPEGLIDLYLEESSSSSQVEE